MRKDLTIYTIIAALTIASIGILPFLVEAKGFLGFLGLSQEERQEVPSFAELQVIGASSLVAKNIPVLLKDIYPVLAHYCPYNRGENYCAITVTAYSSTHDQTDSTPFITAAGTYVRDGVIACNFLPFGTRVQFPDLYGDKIFVVEDRLAWRNSHKIDIWFPSRWQALHFGVRKTPIKILD